MVGFAAIPSVVQFVGFWFLPESPRWLYENKSHKECEEVLSKIYNGDTAWIQFELSEIQTAHDQQRQDAAIYGSGSIIWRILTTPSVRKALLIGCALQAFQQMSGINTIMYYTGKIIQSAGVRDEQITILITVGTASVNFFATLIPMYFVERLGRRILLLSSILGVFIACLLMGGAFLLINRNSAVVQSLNSVNQTELAQCAKLSNCDFCTTYEECGFCAPEGQPGFCLPKDLQKPEKRSLFGPCAGQPIDGIHHINNTKFEWRDEMCKNDQRLTILPILVMVLFLCSFAVGYAPLPWVLNAEFYPLWARGTCAALSTFCNWEFNLIVSLTFLQLSQAVTRFGTFFIYAGVTAVAFAIFYFVVPETKGLNLDEVQLLFMTKRERKRAVTSLKMKQLSGLDLSTVTR
ncbi:hypothetical protein niasHS_008359 [Heterodera schachtii]|uniref:Major facilitator superfamily (MFS) profile domain-containing protein n=1 Tax=Heterodera schachtii TaxID=97005 RepID=A0ABD2JCY2_HETSC